MKDRGDPQDIDGIEEVAGFSLAVKAIGRGINDEDAPLPLRGFVPIADDKGGGNPGAEEEGGGETDDGLDQVVLQQ